MQAMPQKNPFAKLARHFVSAAKAFWRRKAAVDELGLLSASEIACIERDLGISIDELRVLAAGDRNAADLLFRRLKDLRLESGQIDPAVMRELQRFCSQCDSKVLCAHELEDKPKGAVWPKYCPNEETITALQSEAKLPQ